MNTPICDFVKKYAEAEPVRMHMPGHKGNPFIGAETLDITEFDGADELFCPNGIIAESEANASKIFGSRTFYSAGGSTLCIQAMLRLIALNAKKGRKPLVLAGRNAHKAFINACALLDIDIEWLYPQKNASYLSCNITADFLEERLASLAELPDAVYVTSPDYMGNILDIKAISDVCRKAGVTLAVDNAHGAYLKFLPESFHPIDLGADICCDSAHKTLPVLTGGAYLHISDNAPSIFAENAKNSLALFGSSSPSYLILQSLDAFNAFADRFSDALRAFLFTVEGLKKDIKKHGFVLAGNEPLKLTVMPKSCGMTGDELAELLRENNIFCEFHDPDTVVLMLSPLSRNEEIERMRQVLLNIEIGTAITVFPPRVPKPKTALSPREAMLSQSEEVPINKALGKICACAAISCPPAIPIVTCGEIIDENVLSSLEYYGTKKCSILK